MPLSEAERIELQHEVESIYFTPEEAKRELQKRWKDNELKEKVVQYLGSDIPQELLGRPKAVLSRHLMSPNFELQHFVQLAEEMQLEPLGLEYIHDKFVTKNEDKYYLGKMVFFDGVGKHGGRKTSSINTVDFDISDGKRIDEVETCTGKEFVSFHHELLAHWFPSFQYYDMSVYYHRNGTNAKKYYQYILSLFIGHGVLCEAFLTSGFYADLTKDIFLPWYHEVTRYFGVKPLIVRLAPKESEDDIYWRCYPGTYKETVSDILES